MPISIHLHVGEQARRARHAITGWWSPARGLEPVAFLLVFAIASAVRLVRLGTVPRIITGDEASTIQDAIHINGGVGPGIIGYDWAKSPSLHIYPLAWIIRVFGDSASDVRLYGVIFSLLTVVLFYLLAREAMGAPAALAATLLLGTNVWFLNFSRTLWYNINAPFIAVGACWTVTRALKSEGRARWAWWFVTALFVTGGLYGYSTGRFVCLSVGTVALFAAAARVAPWRQTLLGLGMVVVVSTILFAPMAKYIHGHYSLFKERADTVSVFHVKNPDGTTKNGWVLAWRNIEPNYRGMIFQDSGPGAKGPYNARYHPPSRAALTLIAAHLFLAGVALAVFRWRRTYTWFPFIIPAALANIFSGDTPDFGRWLIWAPFYFLFIGLLFDELLRQRWRLAPQPLILAAIAGLTLFLSTYDVHQYFDWQSKPTTQIVRMPGIDECEYGAWIQLIHEATDQNKVQRLAVPGVSAEQFDPIRRRLACSPIVRQMNGYDATNADN